jgi:hypothetical protein
MKALLGVLHQGSSQGHLPVMPLNLLEMNKAKLPENHDCVKSGESDWLFPQCMTN